MIEKLRELQSALSELRDQDISHLDLGVASDFQEAQQEKTRFAEYLLALIERTIRVHARLSPIQLEAAVKQLDGALNNLRSDIKNVEATVEKGIHNTDFPNERKNCTDAFANHRKNFENALNSFDLGVRVAELEELVAGEKSLVKAREKVKALEKDVEEAARQAKQALVGIRKESLDTGLTKAESTFAKLAEAHETTERRWFWWMIVFGIATVIAVLWTAFGYTPSGSTPGMIAAGVQHLLLISLAAAGLRLCLVKFNAERHLRVLYEHRNAVLTQYGIFETAIGEDAESRQAKNQFRIEIAKYVFTDPSTGYSSEPAGSEVNINPVISTVERFLPK